MPERIEIGEIGWPFETGYDGAQSRHVRIAKFGQFNRDGGHEFESRQNSETIKVASVMSLIIYPGVGFFAQSRLFTRSPAFKRFNPETQIQESSTILVPILGKSFFKDPEHFLHLFQFVNL